MTLRKFLNFSATQFSHQQNKENILLIFFTHLLWGLHKEMNKWILVCLLCIPWVSSTIIVYACILHYFGRINSLQIILFPNHIAKHLLTFILALKWIVNWITRLGIFIVAFDFNYTECTCLLRHNFNIRVSVEGLIQILLKTLLTDRISQ